MMLNFDNCRFSGTRMFGIHIQYDMYILHYQTHWRHSFVPGTSTNSVITILIKFYI